MSFWPFRKSAPPEDGVARNLGGGIYEVSVWVAIGWRFDRKNDQHTTNHKVFDNRADAEAHALAWKESGEYPNAWAQHTGTLTIDIGLDEIVKSFLETINAK